jgi:MoxR-like ATPase
VPDDVKSLAVAALAHRVLAKGRVGAPGERGADAESVIRSIIQQVPVPR